jgi:hypothetical protein
MIVIVCVDDKNGMMFNKRRQSKDRVLIDNMIQEIGDASLWMNAYSAKQFSEITKENLTACEEFLDLAREGEYCFVENLSLLHYENQIEQVILYHWNRNYPADFYFDLDLTDWKIIGQEEFVGSSHEKITKEVYVRMEEE